ncbi:hypothetical protein JCM10914A_49240 [Paenibacillus sp. JCM 10914]
MLPFNEVFQKRKAVFNADGRIIPKVFSSHRRAINGMKHLHAYNDLDTINRPTNRPLYDSEL